MPIVMHTREDREQLAHIKSVLPGIAMAYGNNCLVSLHSTETPDFPCIAVENGHINNLVIGAPAAGFVRDAIDEENTSNGRDTVGPYYSRTVHDHSIKCVISLIRNPSRRIIGCMCIGVDLSTPVHEFFNNLIPTSDSGLASGISDPVDSVKSIEDIVKDAVDQAMQAAKDNDDLSQIEKNRFIVHMLHEKGVFNTRGSVNLVAKELGVTRYTIYNYLKK